MSYKINYGTDVCAVPTAALTVEGAERFDLLVLLHVCSDRHLLDDISILAEKIGCKRKKAAAAVDFWCESGIIVQNDEVGCESSQPTDSVNSNADCRSRFDGRPSYNSKDLASMIERDNGMLKSLVEECQKITESVFTPTEIGKVVALHDYLGLEMEHILMLFTYCVGNGKKSVSYIEKTAYNLYDEGIDNTEKFDSYIKKKEQNEARESEIRRLLGITNRSLLTKEKELFRKWTDEWKLDNGIIKRAYEETVEKTGRYHLAYMTKVVESWYMAGYKSAEDVEHAEDVHRQKRSNEKGSFDTDEFLELAIKRSYANSEGDDA